ncbi:MAG: 3-oxoacyl-ACP reductase [Bacteroidia bacterium]|nr:MAG: 3-oxoacyl-ACP reductase [Bacteroidia bacterium]
MELYKIKKILITGASSGIGRTTAIILSQHCSHIYLTARREEKLNETLHLMQKGKHQIIAADLKNSDEIKKLVESLPPLDGWAHCTGKVLPVPVKFIQPKHYEDVFSTNYLSAVHLASELLKQQKLNNNCSIVFISSVSTLHSYFGGALYVSSKAALEAYARTLALELAPKKIRVNVLQPALVKTDIYESTVNAAMSSDEMKKYEQQYPLGIGEPEDIANMILFLLSDASKWITGTCIKMDGGLTLGFKTHQ